MEYTGIFVRRGVFLCAFVISAVKTICDYRFPNVQPRPVLVP